MKATIQQLNDAIPALMALKNAPLPALDAFRIGVFIDKITPELRNAETSRLAVFRKHGTEKGGQISVPPENADALNAELAPLLATEVELSVKPLPLSLLENAPKMTPEHAAALAPFLTEEATQ